MTSTQSKNSSQHNHGMSNAAVLAIGVILGLVGAGAFIYLSNKTDSKLGLDQDTTAMVADTPGEAATSTPVKSTPATTDAVEPSEPAKALTTEEIQQVRQIKAVLDKAIFTESQKVALAVKEANTITAGKQVMSLEQAKLQELSSKV